MTEPVDDTRATLRIGDLALAAALVFVALLSGFFVDETLPDTIAPAAWWHWLLIATPPALVALRRTRPIGATVIATAAQAAIWVSGLPSVLLPMFVLLFSAASDRGRRGVQVAAAAGVVLTIVTAIGVGIAGDVNPYQVPLIAITVGTAIWLGLQAERQRRTAAELAAGIAAARLRGEHERAEAVADERSSIARELHDIIGHTLSTIAVRAEAAHHVGQKRPEAARDAVAAIAESSRLALDETRRVLAGLRTSGAADLAPPPDLASIERLVADVSETGVQATLRTTGCERHRPPAVVVGGAHRIVQESLTNVVKHSGPGTTITVEVTCRPDVLSVSIVDDGRGRRRDARTGTRPDASSPGFGLAGMAERAEVLGGTFSAGPQPEGGFAVRAELPLEVPS